MDRNIGAVAILLRDDDRFLTIQRGPECRCGAGMWSVPGGRKERGERAKATVIREVREEVGVRIITANGIFENTAKHACCDEVWTTVYFLSTHFVGYPEASKECPKFFWATLDDMPSPLWPTFANSIKGRTSWT